MDSETFKKIRTDNNLTQEELANFLACSKSLIEKIEGGAEIKSKHILDVMKSIQKWGVLREANENLSRLEQFKIDCAQSINNLISILEMSDEDIKAQQDEYEFDYLKELKIAAKGAVEDFSDAIELI